MRYLLLGVVLFEPLLAFGGVRFCVENVGTSSGYCVAVETPYGAIAIGTVLVGQTLCHPSLHGYPSGVECQATFFTNSACSGTKQYGSTGYTIDGETLTLTIIPGPPAPTNNCWVLEIVNHDPVARTYDVGTGDCGETNHVIQHTVTLQPGESATYVSCSTNGIPDIISACKRNLHGYGYDEQTIASLQQNQLPLGSYTNSTPQITGGKLGSGRFEGSTTNIVWTGTNDTQQGFSALYDAISKVGQQLHSDVEANTLMVSNGVTVLKDETKSGFNSVSNALDVAVQLLDDIKGSSCGVTNLLGDMVGLGHDITNLLGGFTNGFGDSEVTNLLTAIRVGVTNTARGEAISNSVLSLVGTNSDAATTWAGAYSQAETVLDREQIEGRMDGLVEQFSDMEVPAAPSKPVMTMKFVGQTVDLDPVTRFESVFYASKVGGMVVVTVTFALFVGRLFWKVIGVHSSQQLGGVPNLEVSGAGFGGNMAGAAVAVVVPLVFVTAWTAIVGALITTAADQLALGTWFSTWSGSLGQIGWYILNEAFPVQFAITCFITAMVLQFTTAKAVMVAQVCSRFLWGK